MLGAPLIGPDRHDADLLRSIDWQVPAALFEQAREALAAAGIVIGPLFDGEVAIDQPEGPAESRADDRP